MSMRMKVSILFALGVVLQLTNGTKQDKLDNLIKDIKRESDKVANEIYAWIDHHKNDVTNYIKSHPKTYAKGSKAYVDGLAKTLQGESDHLANEIYSWIGKHKLHDQSRGHKRHHHKKWRHFSLRVLKHLKSSDWPRGHPRGSHVTWSRKHKSESHVVGPRGHLRIRRATENVNDGLEGKSIQDVMMDLMNSSHSEKKNKIEENKKKNAKTTKSKVKKPRKTKKAIKKSKVYIRKKPSKQAIIKKTKKNKTPKLPKAKRSKKTIITHGPTVNLHKTPSLPDLLKVISADPARKIVVTNKEDNVKIDKKSLKILKEIPKSVLKKLLKNINLDKYIRMADYLPNGSRNKGRNKNTKEKVGSGHVVKKNVSVKKKATKTVQRGWGSAATHFKSKKKISSVKISKKVSTAKKVANLVPKKNIKTAKVSKKNGIIKVSKSKPKVTTKSKISVKKGNSSKVKELNNVDHAHKKLSFLKEKIKKTNSLKFKVAKALLEHCETQNKLKKIFDNVNSSLKEAALVAKAIGKKFGIKTSDIDRLSTAHTEEAVTEFLDKFF